MEKVLIADLDITVVDGTMQAALEELNLRLREHYGRFVVFFEANLLSLSIQDPEVRDCIRQADLVFPDGIAVSKLVSFYSGRQVERISGPSFMLKACEYGQSRNWKHFFYGGTPEAMEKLQANLREKYPDIRIAGAYIPPFRPLTVEEEAEMQRQIALAQPDFLWVGLGGPKQENWIMAHRNTLKVPVMLGVGAAFDFHSGARPWAPKAVRRLGLEWLFRAVSGGRRTFVRNVCCVSRVFCYLIRERIRLWCGKNPRK